MIRWVCDYCGDRGTSKEDMVESVLGPTCGEPVLELEPGD
jgi:hypothetical protein